MSSTARKNITTLAVATLGASLLAGLFLAAGPLWAALAAMPVGLVVWLEAGARTGNLEQPQQLSAREHVVQSTLDGSLHHDAPQRLERAIRATRTAEVFDLAEHQAARGPVASAAHDADHLAVVIQLPVRSQQVERLRAHA